MAQPPPMGPPPWPMEHRYPGLDMRVRVTATIILGVAWLVFILLFAAFWSGPYTLFQNIVILIVSFVILIGLVAVIWASWGMRFARW